MIKKASYVYNAADGTTLSRDEFYDTQYGKNCPPWNKMISKYKLFLKDGTSGEVALTELRKPIWGPNNDMIFADYLPVQAVAVSPTLSISTFRQYPAVIPTEPEGTMYICRLKWGQGYKTYSPLPYHPLFWAAMQITEWKIDGEPSFTTIPNPDYVEYVSKFNEYKSIIQNTFDIYGYYQFPGLPFIEGYRWFEDDIEVEKDINHFLSVLIPGWKFIWMPTNLTNVSTKWDTYTRDTLFITDKDLRVRKLLGL